MPSFAVCAAVWHFGVDLYLFLVSVLPEFYAFSHAKDQFLPFWGIPDFFYSYILSV